MVQLPLLYESNKKSIVILIIIFISSYSFLSFNLEGQGIDVDEWFHHGYAMAVFDLIKEGEFSDSCITLQGNCEKIDLSCTGDIYHIGSGGIIKQILVGAGDHWFSDSERVYYTSTDLPCRPIQYDLDVRGINTPTQPELSAARFFSPIFGSLTVVISFLIGNMLFNRFVGISFATTIMFHGFWIHYSRILLPEVFQNFFMILAIFLLLLSIKKEKINFKFFLLASFTFALAVNTKITALEIFPFLIVIIFFRTFIGSKIEFSKIIHKKNLIKSIGLISIFFSIFFVSLLVTFPYYWPDPIGQIELQINSLDSENYPTLTTNIDAKKIFLPFIESVTIAPVIELYYYIFLPEEIPDSLNQGHTFTSIPLSLFFIIGLGYIIWKIKTKKIIFEELIIFGWYLSVYLTLTPLLESYSSTKQFLPIIFPMALIMSYGLWRFIENFSYKKIKIFFFSLTLFIHSITFLIFWKMIYFEPFSVWALPMTPFFNFREAMLNPIILYSGISFLIIFSILFICKKYLLIKKV